ncbi:MAG: galactokinase, partial [Bacteroidales bacterium]
SLRAATMELLDEVKGKIPGDEYKRARYVIGEVERVLAVCDALKHDDYEMVGKMMYDTHYGLSKEYEVSCEELDFLNDIAKEEGVTGSRIMGGGFGGCTINLVADELVENFKKVVVEKFAAKYGKKPIIIDVVIGDGARKLL